MSAPVDARRVLRETLYEIEAAERISRDIRTSVGLHPDDSIAKLRQAVGAVEALVALAKIVAADHAPAHPLGIAARKALARAGVPA